MEETVVCPDWIKSDTQRAQFRKLSAIDREAAMRVVRRELPMRRAAIVADPLPFGQRTARMLAAIASNPVVSNRKHASVLPSSWNTLYELSRIPPQYAR